MDDDPIKAMLEGEKSLEDVADDYDVEPSELAEKFGATDEPDEEETEKTETDDGADAVEGLEEKLDALEERIEEISKATGTSQQATVDGDESGDEGVSKADILGLPGGDN